MYLSSKNSHFVPKITVLLILALNDKFGPLRGALFVTGSEHDIWPFDDLNVNIESKGNARHEQSPVGKGLYLDGTFGTYVKLQGHEKSCLGHPSDCDITIGFFLKLMPKSGLQIFFGNKDANDTLYEGVNIYLKGSFHVMVYGKDKYCSRVISPPRGVWFYLGLVWEKAGNLAVYVDSWFSNSIPSLHCGNSPNGLKTREDYFLGRNTFPIAYYKDLNIWYSKQLTSVLDGKLNPAFDNGPHTEISLKIIFSDLVYDSVKAAQWKMAFYNKVNEIYTGDAYFMEIRNISVSESDGTAAVSFTLKFTRMTWQSVLTLQLAMENGAFLESPGFLDEVSCENEDDDNFICEAPKNAAPSTVTYNTITITMDPVSVQQHDDYFYGYRILYKNLDEPNSQWAARSVIRNNVPPIMAGVYPLRPYTNYSFRMSAVSFQSEGLISEVLRVRTAQWVPSVGPVIAAYHSMNSTSIYVQWSHSIPQKLANGILIGYRLAWYEDHYSVGHPLYSGGYADVGLDTSDYTVSSLHEFWLYHISVAGRTSVGHGIYTTVSLMTDDNVPSAPPSDVQLNMANETALHLYWNDVSLIHQNGRILGYRLHLQREDDNSVVWNITVKSDVHMYVFSDLLIFHNYSIQLMAFTVKGDGPWSEKVYQTTDESVPEAPPKNFTAYNISQTKIQLVWVPVPQDKVNGIVTGYNISYKKAEGDQPAEHRTFNSSTVQAIIGGLEPFTIYKLNVRAFTVKGHGPPSPFITVKTDEEAPQVAPASFQGINSSSTSIVLRWDPIPEDEVAGVLRSFYITYRQLGTADNTTYNITVPITNVTVEITNLRKYTNYSLDVTGVTKFLGAATEPIIITTGEDVPSLPPQNITSQNSSSTSILVQWKPIPNDYIHGILLGIKLLYRSAPRDNSIVFSSRARRSTEEDWSGYTNITLPPNALSYEMTFLKKFTNYTVVILGFTSKGDGNVSHQFVVSTDEDVPSMPPSNFLPISHSGSFKMEVTWGPVPDGFVHGILLGYHIYYTKSRQTGRAVSSNTEVITVGPYEQDTTITLLTNFAIYGLEIAAFTIKGDGVRSEVKDGLTCKCPREFKTSWYPFPPYIKYEEGAVGGLLLHILEDAVQYCCRDCRLANGKSASTINFELDGKGNPAQKSDVETFIRSIDSQTDLSAPVNVHKGQRNYSLYPHLELAESPGIAFIAVIDHKDDDIAVENLFLETWPLLLVTSVMMLGVGILIWIMETRSNRAEFPRSFFQGAYEGFWWAFITSTTVGYGDRCPRGVLSRLFAIVWSLCGLVIVVIITGRLTSALTDYRHAETNVELYGAEVAAIENHSDFRLGVLKNARVNTVRKYKNYEEVSQALRDREVKGALVDLYVLSSYEHLFDDPRFRIVRVYDYKASFGVVLAGHSMKLKECFTEYTKAHAASVFRRIKENIRSLKEPEYHPVEEHSTNLFDINSPQFITTVIITLALLLLACLMGLIYESRRRKISRVLTQSKDLKNEMSPLVDSFFANIKKKVEELSKRHRQERCHLMQVERERNQQASDAVKQYYEVLNLRDIRQEWCPRDSAVPVKSVAPSLSRRNSYTTEGKWSLSPMSVKGMASPLSCRKSYNLTMWPFTESPNHLSPNVAPTMRPATLPLRRKHGFDIPAAPVALEPNVRVVDETSL